MFSANTLDLGGQCIEFREENLTGLRCRINVSRKERGLNSSRTFEVVEVDPGCPFCPQNIEEKTPVFKDGKRIRIGESTTFPNRFPFGENHIVTVVTRDHLPKSVTCGQIEDALFGQFEALNKTDGYASINWNYLPSAGASIIHPHLQGICERRPTFLTGLYLERSKKYSRDTGENYWASLRESERLLSKRYLFGESIVWCASPVPLGEKEIRGYLPVCGLVNFEELIPETAVGIKRVIDYYTDAGSSAFNMTIRFGRDRDADFFRAFVSMIARIDPNPLSFSDSAFMERLHFEPVVMTVPEEIPSYFEDPAI